MNSKTPVYFDVDPLLNLLMKSFVSIFKKRPIQRVASRYFHGDGDGWREMYNIKVKWNLHPWAFSPDSLQHCTLCTVGTKNASDWAAKQVLLSTLNVGIMNALRTKLTRTDTKDQCLTQHKKFAISSKLRFILKSRPQQNSNIYVFIHPFILRKQHWCW